MPSENERLMMEAWRAFTEASHEMRRAKRNLDDAAAILDHYGQLWRKEQGIENGDLRAALPEYEGREDKETFKDD